jgi:N-methylhydantoinase A/oxoprolinase/acetone carboxylase beta subunit
LVHQTLELQISSEPWQENFGYFAVPLSNTLEGLDEAEKKFLESLTGQPKALFNLIQRRRDKLILKRLVALKRLALSAFTPSDAAHVLGVHNAWDVTAARKGAELFARQKNKKGQRIAADAASLSNWVHKTVSEHSSELILEAVLAEDGYKAGLSKHPLLTAALDTKPGFLRLGLSLSAPIVGLGASAKLYYPNVGKRLATQTIIPEHAEVANAVGAVMGLVRTEVSLLISQPQEGCFRVHHPEKPSDFSDLEQAFVFTEETAKRLATQKAKQAGAKDIELKLEKRIKRPQLDNESMFLEAQIVVTAFGRPGF